MINHTESDAPGASDFFVSAAVCFPVISAEKVMDNYSAQ